MSPLAQGRRANRLFDRHVPRRGPGAKRLHKPLAQANSANHDPCQRFFARSAAKRSRPRRSRRLECQDSLGLALVAYEEIPWLGPEPAFDLCEKCLILFLVLAIEPATGRR